MDYPRHGHHHQNEPYPDGDEYPPRGPPFYDAPPPQHPSYYGSNAPPPPSVAHVSHTSHAPGGGYDYPPTGGYGHPPQVSNYPPYATSPPPVQHTSHSSPYTEVDNNPHHFKPHMPAFIHHHEHQGADVAVNKPTVRVYSKAEPNYSLAIRDGTVILAISNPSDPFQHWIKDEKYSTKVKDEQGYPSFVLVNKATGQAIKHSVGATHPVQLVQYVPNKLDESILWTESKDLGDSYRTIRMVNNIKLNVDALNGDKNHGGVRDGTKIVLWEWKKGDNQRWKIVPY